MNPQLIFAKTPKGEDAVRQSTLVHRNLRMVLLQVDGQLCVAELSEKLRNREMVEQALLELEADGYIVATIEAATFSRSVKPLASSVAPGSGFSSLSEFSTFDPAGATVLGEDGPEGPESAFSDFGKTKKTEAVPLRLEEENPTIESVARPQRRVPWRTLFSLMFLVFVVFPALLIVLSYQRAKPRIEALASAWLGVPVAVNSLSVSFSPIPVLKLHKVELGTAGEIAVNEIVLPSPLSLWRQQNQGVLDLPMVELSGISCDPGDLVNLPRLLVGGAAGEHGLHVGKLSLRGLKLGFGEKTTFEELGGEISFSEDGLMEKAVLANLSRTLLISVTPGTHQWGIQIEGREWQPEGLPSAFGLFEAVGTLYPDRLQLKSVDTSFIGGLVKGEWSLAWGQGLQMAGEGVLQRLDAAKISAVYLPMLGLEGGLSASGRFRGTGDSWKSLWKSLEGNFDLELVQGAVIGIDPVEAARRNGPEIRGGSVRFQSLKGNLVLSARQSILKSVRLEAGPIKISSAGVTLGREGQIEGTLDVATQTLAATQHAVVKLSGEASNAVAIVAK